MTRILVVDDEYVDREVARRVLAEYHEKLELEFANDGQQALDLVNEKGADLVLTDLRMPEMDGLELVEHISEDHPLVPVVLMTAKGSEQIAVKALAAGAASYVPKDEIEGELLDTVAQVLDVAESRRSRSKLLAFLHRETHFEIVNDIHLIQPLVSYFQASLERLEFGDEAVRTRIGMALSEGVANAIVRGNLEIGSELRATDRDAYDALIASRQGEAPYSDRRVYITATESVDEVIYTIRDEGNGFDPEDVPDPTAAENLLAVSGRGIMLMRTFMDEVKYNEKGSCVTLIKRAESVED
ncbi:MAG: response regulator [Acidobacteria bacterium]|nr:response regulator [Acidobacteriota bacterium]